MQKNVYIFDFDGTLADSKHCSVVATQEAFKAHDLLIPDESLIEEFMGIPIETSFKKMANTELSSSMFDELLQTFRTMYKKYENELIVAFPLIPEVLQKRKQQGSLLFVVSSKKSDVLRRNLRSLHIEEFFNGVMGSDNVNNYKPHPEGILNILAENKFRPSQCIMIGDSTFDIEMAKAAGVQSCGVTWGAHSKEMLANTKPTYLIHDVKDLLHIAPHHSANLQA
ncbi:HAD family hydrolase [Priestia taiwanensis]|uniref:Haloacid dehalogenase n=1 Tax=Priestia taiwanensis TaxID=1347902 RepID=A0A917EPY8_9BACI|nr:HAD family hydrolase [Priestia taiwanensis]MBM7362651.1 HAD superfamily hydrolase (TIGR01549 family) [Priestia taiwanensis]GGE63955.1 haloacid dehalogenase [Priestia taiwanensis]